MWANTVDGGLIVVGMENNGGISGCSTNGVEYVNKLESHARDHCPDARVEARRLVANNAHGVSDFLLLFRVHYDESRVVKTSAGDAFIRSGQSKRRLKSSEIRELEIDKGQVDIEQELCGSIRFPDDFDARLVEDFIASVRERSAYPEHLTETEILELRRLGRRKDTKFIPNTACVLMFAKDPIPLFPGCKVRFLRHEGEVEGTGKKWNVVKDINLEGNVPTLISLTESALRSQLREFSRLGDDARFYTAPEYPRDAWFEAVVNACVHRSYGEMKKMNIFVRMFDDRLEVESPGGFPPPVNAQNIYEMHHPRNPILMDAMLFLNFVKCAREGTRRMRETMKELDFPPPQFAEREEGYPLVKVTLRNSRKQRKEWLDSNVYSVVGAEVAQTLDARELRTVNFVSENGRANVAQISKLLDCHWKTARRLMGRLVRKGVLLHIHRKDIVHDNHAHFVLKEKMGLA